MVTVLKYAERKCVCQIGSLHILTSEKCTVPLKKWMPASILRIIIVPTAERITQTMGDWKFSYQNKYSTIQRMDEYHFYCDKNRCITSRFE